MPAGSVAYPTSATSSMAIEIHSRAPTRIDLAGGTIDIWPLYLFVEQPVTVNLAIDLFAEADLNVDPGPGKILLRSEDQLAEMELSWKALASPKPAAIHPALELHYRLLRHFALRQSSIQECRLTLSTRARSPAGAGLGGSSALSVAMVGALSTWFNNGADRTVDVLNEGERLIDVVRDVETTVIDVPAGMQDYYGAMYGGLQSLRWGIGEHKREWLPDKVFAGLENRLLLFYSGQSRNSGINNWALFKSFIDKDALIREKFNKISAAARTLNEALRTEDWDGAAAAIDEEWLVRRGLGSGISTTAIDRAFESAKNIAPITGKICGAGGGGCLFVFLPNRIETDSPEVAKISEAFTNEGMRPIAFRAVPRGLEVRVTRA
jgi:D-glycero-alpha-D-manno-heptose-7-phosphate kinase